MEYVGLLIEGNQVRGSVFYVIDETNGPIKALSADLSLFNLVLGRFMYRELQ